MKRATLQLEGATLTSCALTMVRDSGYPLHRQVCDFLRRAILSGEFPPGSSLPSTRALAKQLGISRNTVLRAYESLADEGFAGARIGSGTRVRALAARPKTARDLRFFLRESHYPADAAAFRDPDGNPLYIHR
jgi:DNA-binding transcriptional regulator YhcF (GntR family)